MDKTGFSIKSIVGKVVLPVAALVLLLIIPTAAGQESQRDNTEKQQVLHEVAQKWIEVGREQYNRGLYKQAKQSLLFAQDYQECLTAAEREQLKALQEKACAAAAEREHILEDINRAGALAEQGQLIKAKVRFERLREATTLTKEEQKLAAEGLKDVNQRLSEQKKEIAELYRQSMDFYGEGEIEKAREGFSKIDNILAMMAGSSTETTEKTAESISESAVLITDEKEANETMRGHEEERKEEADIDTEEAVEVEITQEPNEFSAVSVPEPPKYESGGSEMTTDRKGNILRSYTKAVVNDAAAKVQSYISEGSFEEAKEAIEAAKQTVNKNRQYLGNDLFQQYISQLEQLREKITEKPSKRN